MDREIKFQGNRLDDGQRVEGGIYQTKDGRVFIIEDTWTEGDPIHPGEIIRMFDGHEVDPATVGQFIGRQDGHGQDMYEGDKAIWIAKANAELNYEGVISWDEKSLGWSHGDCEMDIYDNYKIIDETEVSHGATDDG